MLTVPAISRKSSIIDWKNTTFAPVASSIRTRSADNFRVVDCPTVIHTEYHPKSRLFKFLRPMIYFELEEKPRHCASSQRIHKGLSDSHLIFVKTSNHYNT